MEQTCRIPQGCPCTNDCNNHGVCQNCIAKHNADGSLVACMRPHATEIFSHGLKDKALKQALNHGMEHPTVVEFLAQKEQ
ncbi:hypothetical protein LJC20_01210 [Eubacteriales bacterium OttesenSCG-928-M02]|nr:hypothetical protein [Eubacteriales bacterium OttesenSCG-928-M02]